MKTKFKIKSWRKKKIESFWNFCNFTIKPCNFILIKNMFKYKPKMTNQKHLKKKKRRQDLSEKNQDFEGMYFFLKKKKWQKITWSNFSTRIKACCGRFDSTNSKFPPSAIILPTFHGSTICISRKKVFNIKSFKHQCCFVCAHFADKQY